MNGIIDGTQRHGDTDMSNITDLDIQTAFAAISPDAIGSGCDADGNPDGSDNWDHDSAAAARKITADLDMQWDFTTWADAERLAHDALA